MDKNVIFLFPLNKVLLELKKEIEQDSSYNLFEVDMIEEYQQVVGTLDSSITFSTDLKKTENYLSRCKKIISSKQHKNILLAKDNLSGLVLSKMEKNGLDEVLNEFIPLKTLSHKIKVFFKTLEASQVQSEHEIASRDMSIDTQSRQRIERLTKEEERAVTEDLTIKNNQPLLVGSFKFNTYSAGLNLNKTFHNLKNKIKDIRFERLMTLEHSDEYEVEIQKEQNEDELASLINSESIDYLSFPEVQFYPAIKIFDPLVLYMETLIDGLDIDFKRKFINMVLQKRYNARVSFVDINDLDDNAKRQTTPTWVNEARNSDINHFVLPVLNAQGVMGQVVLEVSGSVNFEKMNELEFWCYLGKNLWN
jgi:hypothetical protein